MWLRLKDLDRDAPRRKLRWIGFIAFLSVGLFGVAARAADAPPISPPTTDAAAAPAADMNMHSAGWLERIIVDLEREASSDISMLPDTPSALGREWRSFDRGGSAVGGRAAPGWGVAAACIGLFAGRLAGRALRRRSPRGIRRGSLSRCAGSMHGLSSARVVRSKR